MAIRRQSVLLLRSTKLITTNLMSMHNLKSYPSKRQKLTKKLKLNNRKKLSQMEYKLFVAVWVLILNSQVQKCFVQIVDHLDLQVNGRLKNHKHYHTISETINQNQQKISKEFNSLGLTVINMLKSLICLQGVGWSM